MPVAAAPAAAAGAGAPGGGAGGVKVTFILIFDCNHTHTFHVRRFGEGKIYNQKLQLELRP